MKKPAHSADFKKDYIAYSAIMIFFLIILFEIFMAIFIPAHLQIEGVWGEEVARQEMINQFDFVRNRISGLKSDDEYAVEESRMIGESLIPLANYLRIYQYEIGIDEVKNIEKAMSGFSSFRSSLEKKGAYSKDMKLKTGKFIATLKKEMAKTK